ncbi:MAG: DNA (cytosine-5-)-methyltransferase [Planctomycetota bacterium]
MGPKAPPTPLRTAGFFAGVGGLERGLERSGHQAVYLCEYESGAQAVLQRHFPDVPLAGDVREVESLPECDLVTAGFPCQDLSQAGRTAGIGGEQSGLIQRVFELIRRADHRPEWLLLENVPFMLQLERGKGMRYLVQELANLEYRWAYRVINAQSFGLPQRRQRVVLVAARNGDPRGVLLSDDGKPPEAVDVSEAAMCGFYWTEGIRGLGWAVEAVPTLKGGSTVGIPSPPAIWDRRTGLIGTPSIRDAERLQGFPSHWTKAAKTVAGVRAGFRWRLVGNAVNVRMSEWLGRQLVRPGTYDDSDDMAVRPGTAWPGSGWGEGKSAFKSSVGPWVPVRRQRPLLSEFLRDELKPLSIRATAGFLSRTEKSSLRFPEGFLEAIRSHLRTMESTESKAAGS